MKIIGWLLGVAVFFTAAVLLTAYLCYRRAFYAKPRLPLGDRIETPEGKIYDPFREHMEKWARETRAMPCENFSITSFDGLTLTGKYYEYAPGAPIELMFHGYRGSAERDLPGGVQRCFHLGRSVLLADQRCSGNSQGHTITFGIYEHRDCLAWVDFMTEHFGSDVKTLLTGISMGASTVLMAAGRELPHNVIGVLADCGFSSPKEIIRKVITQMGLPAAIAYPFVKLGAKLYGRFDLEAYSPIQAMKEAKVPVIFFHGESDDFVPCDMSRAMYAACVSRKKLVTVPNAGHGLSYPMAPKAYLDALNDFFGPEASVKEA